MAQGNLSEIVQVLKGLDPALRVSEFGSWEVLALGSRDVRVIWLPNHGTLVAEFSCQDVLSAKLQTPSSDVVLRTAQAWLLSESLLSELARLHTEFIPTVEGLALERGALRDHLWSNLEHIAPPTMKEFVAQACKEPPLRNAYPIFSLNTLALNRTASTSTTGKIASVRCVEGRGYEVADSRRHSVGLGDAQWAITTLSNLVSESLKADG
jgi:Family of unknown function (DUF6193)